MKKFFLLLPLLLVVATLTAFAHSTTNTDPRIEQAFKKQFAGAANVKWSKAEGGLLQASFTWADHRTIAYFNSNAELVGSIRGLFFNQLPLSVIRSFDGHFKNPVILEIREISNIEGVHYKLVVEDNNRKYKIRLNGLGDLMEKEKLKK